jgi:hypothetical protein
LRPSLKKTTGRYSGIRLIGSVLLTVDGMLWAQTLVRANFNAGKRKLLWMQNGGEAGIELDDIRVTDTGAKS